MELAVQCRPVAEVAARRSAFGDPVAVAGSLANTRIETVGGVERAVVFDQREFGLIEVADIVLGGVFSTARVKQREHLLLHRRGIRALF